MQFNSHATNLDIVSDVLFWTGTTVDDYPLVDITRNANFALDRVVSLIQKADNKWEWEDSNNSDLPIATTSLVADQSDYSLAVTHLKIHKLRIKDPNGNLISLEPKNRKDMTDSELTESAGTPRTYDKMGNSVFLFPKPSYASTGGLEIQFQRGANYFASTDTTKVPGFATQFHRLVPLYAARDYCSKSGLDSRVAVIDKEITKLESELVEFYSARNFDEKQFLSLRKEDFGEDSVGRARGGSHPDRFYR